MTNTSVAHPAHPEYTVDEATRSRVLRGVSLFRERAVEIKNLGLGRYSVPSSKSGEDAYTVNLDIFSDEPVETCTCRDFRPHGEKLGIDKHIVAATILRAKHAAANRRKRAERPRRSPADVAASLERMGG